MIVEMLEKQQKQELVELKKLTAKNRKDAVELARKRLQSAKLIDLNGNLALPYR